MMNRSKTRQHRRVSIFFFVSCFLFIILMGRLAYIMVIKGEYYSMEARKLLERERQIKAARGRLLDRNGVVIADNRVVCTISVIHNQIENAEEVTAVLSKELELSEEYVEKRVNKRSSIERIKSNVEKEVGDRIREYHLPGVKVDEDYKRFYPYEEIGSKVIGFTGSDNQGIIGLEVKYEEYLKGKAGTILTMTDARGVEIETEKENRIEPIKGNDLRLTLDWNIQRYATQLCYMAMEEHEADRVSMLVMNPTNGEIYAMADVPEFNLNEPYDVGEYEYHTDEEYQEILNGIWRNGCINDTYEPGSTFKIITAAAGLEAGLVSTEDSFHCPGYIVVEDRRIRCHKTNGHGSETFTQGIMNSCNPVFISVGLRLGVDDFYSYFTQFGLFQQTGIDLPGEAGTIMHRKENMKAVELATCAFGQSFQITPIQLVTTVSMIINGGDRVTPHFAMRTIAPDGSVAEEFAYEVQSGLVSEDTSETVQYLLEQVVSEGTGRNGYVEGFSVGGKTATSQTLPRGSGKYIASFIGFAPAEDPEVCVTIIVEGAGSGGDYAVPIARRIFDAYFSEK